MTAVWTIKRLEAAIQACEAMLSGEEGEGDATDVKFVDLQAAAELLKDDRARLLRRPTRTRVRVKKP